jgi:hypothetical protein
MSYDSEATVSSMFRCLTVPIPDLNISDIDLSRGIIAARPASYWKLTMEPSFRRDTASAITSGGSKNHSRGLIFLPKRSVISRFSRTSEKKVCRRCSSFTRSNVVKRVCRDRMDGCHQKRRIVFCVLNTDFHSARGEAKPDRDKQSRLISQIDLFEGGSVLLPKDAPWLDAFVSELVSFPGRHGRCAVARTRVVPAVVESRWCSERRMG